MIISKEQIKIILEGLQNCIFDSPTPDTYHDDIISHLDQTVFNLSDYGEGCTKLVLMPKNCDFVVKIPFFGENYDSKTGTYIQFSGAREPEGWNYCEVESILYTYAKEKKVENYFLETRCIGFVHGYPIYAQELATTLNRTKPSDYDDDLSVEERTRNTKIRELCRKRNAKCFNATWIADFIDYYSEEEWFKLNKFLYDFDITDLHTENIGYNSAGAPTVMDYAGYRD